MVAVATAMNTVARECSVTPPASWVSATELTHVELRDDFLYQGVEELQDRVDWPAPVGKVQDITGDGSTSFDLNADFKRLVRKQAIYESANTRRFGVPFTSEGEYQYVTDLGTAGAYRYFRTAGYDGAFSIEFYPATATGDAIKVAYVSNLWKATSGGVLGSEWTNDDDVLIYPRRLFELAVIFRFKRKKSLPHADVLQEFELKLSREGNDAKLIRVVDGSDVASESKPMRVPIPDFLPGA